MKKRLVEWLAYAVVSFGVCLFVAFSIIVIAANAAVGMWRNDDRK